MSPFQQIRRRKATVLPVRRRTLGETGAVAFLVRGAIHRRAAARGVVRRLRSRVHAPVALPHGAPVGSAIGTSTPRATREGQRCQHRYWSHTVANNDARWEFRDERC